MTASRGFPPAPTDAQAREAILPITILLDPDDLADKASGELRGRLRDAVRPERCADGATVGVGWGQAAWRARLRLLGDEVRVSGKPATAPARAGSPRESWIAAADTAMAELLPNAVDAGVRRELATRILAGPEDYAAEQLRILGRLLAAYRVLRWASRRALLQAVASWSLGEDFRPAELPSLRLLARLSHVPDARLRGDAAKPVLAHDRRPWCPIARRMAPDRR